MKSTARTAGALTGLTGSGGAGGSLRSTPDPWLTHPVALALLAVLPSLTFHEQALVTSTEISLQPPGS